METKRIGTDARHIRPLDDRFRIRLFTCIRLLTEGKIKYSDCWKYLRKEKNTPIENTVLQLAQAVSLTTAELVTCIDRGSIPAQDDEVMEKLYDGTDDSYETLAEEAQLCHTQYPILQAVGNLYLNKQISFQSF